MQLIEQIGSELIRKRPPVANHRYQQKSVYVFLLAPNYRLLHVNK